MKATGFKVGNYTSRRSGEVSKKLVVKFPDGHEYFLWCNRPEFTDKSVEECVEIIKKDRETYLNEVVIENSQFGPQAQFSVVSESEEF